MSTISTMAPEPVPQFNFSTIKELYATSTKYTSWCVDDMLPSSGLSALIGKPKQGKTTIARQLIVAVATGKPFLKRDTKRGTVIYIVLEEKESEIAQHFKALGLDENSQAVKVVCGAVDKKQALPMLEQALKTIPDLKLVVIDPLWRFLGVRDVNDYVQVNDALEELLSLARTYGVHIAVVHHTKKREADDCIDSPLGSTAIAAGVDTLVILTRSANGKRTIATRQRYGPDLQETQLDWNAEKKSVSLGLTQDEADHLKAGETRARVENDILAHVDANTGATQDAILEAVKGKTILKKNVLRELIDNGHLLQQGGGTKGAPYTYKASFPVEA